jgi:hypothetical protein
MGHTQRASGGQTPDQASSAGSGPLPATAGGQVRCMTPPGSVIPRVTPAATDRSPDHHRTVGSLTVIPPGPTRRAAGRPPMGRTGLPAAPGSRHRGSVDDPPRYGDRAGDPPGPSDSPSWATPEGARRPARYGGTSARLAVAPYAPFWRVSPMWGTTLPPSGATAIQRSTQRASRRLTAWETTGT